MSRDVRLIGFKPFSHFADCRFAILDNLQRTNAAQAERMARIAAAGVKFAASENTMRRMKVQKSDLFDFVVTVDSGVAELVRKQEAGWAYLKGGG